MGTFFASTGIGIICVGPLKLGKYKDSLFSIYQRNNIMIKNKIYIKTILKIAAALIVCHAAFVYAGKHVEDDLYDLSLEELMNIKVTSVSKKPQNLSDSAAAIFVITNKDLLRSGATSIPEALRMVPGIHVARIDSNKWAVSSRGFNNRFTKKLLVLIDGRSVYTPSFSGVYWEVQDVMMEDVDRIEVIRGPGASLWGANAVNGVINIITKHAADTQGGLVSAGGGNIEGTFGSVRYGASPRKDTYGRIYAKYFKRDEFEYKSGGNAGDDWDTFRTGFRMDSELKGPDNLTFQGEFYTGDINQTAVNAPAYVPPYSQVVEDDIDVSGVNLLARWQRILSSTSDFSLQAYYDRTKREDIYIHEKRDCFDLDFQHHFTPANRHELIWGARYSYTHDDFTNQFIAEIDPDSRSAHLFSGFIQDEISIVKEILWLILGSKFEHNDYSGYEIQPSARLLWAPHSDHRFWAAVSRALRNPSRVEHDGRLNVVMVPPSPPSLPFPMKVIIVGNKSFDSEELLAYEGGYRFVPDYDLSLDLSFFFNDYNELQNYAEFAPVLSRGYLERFLFIENDTDGYVYGLEVSAVWQPTKFLKTDLAYSFLNSHVTGMEAPKHQVSLRTSFSPAKNIDMDVWLRYVDDTKTNRSSSIGLGTYDIDDFVTLDLRIAWRLTENLELVAVGQDLLDEGHMEFVQEILISPTAVSRSFYGQIKYLF